MYSFHDWIEITSKAILSPLQVFNIRHVLTFCDFFLSVGETGIFTALYALAYVLSELLLSALQQLFDLWPKNSLFPIQ